MTWFLVFIGGGVGSLCRYGIGNLLNQQGQTSPITATFIINIISCFIAGFLIAALPKSSVAESGRLLLLTGFCGGFSTFSTFSVENMDLIIHQQWMTAILYTTLSIIAGLLFAFLGYKIY